MMLSDERIREIISENDCDRDKNGESTRQTLFMHDEVFSAIRQALQEAEELIRKDEREIVGLDARINGVLIDYSSGQPVVSIICKDKDRLEFLKEKAQEIVRSQP